jgi:hypothetical protein
MAGPYTNLGDKLQQIKETVVTSFPDAETVLNNIGAPSTAYIDIYYQDGTINRLSDGTRISDLSETLRLFYYPRLNQLFKLAYNAKIYGA